MLQCCLTPVIGQRRRPAMAGNRRRWRFRSSLDRREVRCLSLPTQCLCANCVAPAAAFPLPGALADTSLKARISCYAAPAAPGPAELFPNSPSQSRSTSFTACGLTGELGGLPPTINGGPAQPHWIIDIPPGWTPGTERRPGESRDISMGIAGGNTSGGTGGTRRLD